MPFMMHYTSALLTNRQSVVVRNKHAPLGLSAQEAHCCISAVTDCMDYRTNRIYHIIPHSVISSHKAQCFSQAA